MENRQTLASLQYLRAIAALMVVVHHVINARGMVANDTETADLGRLGVMVSFVLSGFLMLHTNRSTNAVDFLRRRVVRVVPLYWILTFAFFAIHFRNDLFTDDPLRRVPSLLASLFFVPHNHLSMTDQVWPVLVPGWTLNFEMFFYCLFAVGLLLGRPGLFAGAAVVALVGLGGLTDPQGAVLQTWTDPLMLLFVAGLLLADLRSRVSFRGLVWLFPAALGLTCVCALGWAGGAAGAVAYLASIGMVLGCVALADRAPDFRLPLLGRLGDASYAIYLSHTIFLIALLPLLRLLPLSGWPQFTVISLLAVGLSTAMGVLLHDWLERPLTQFLRRRLDRPPIPMLA